MINIFDGCLTNLSETGTCLAPLPMLALSVQLRTDLFPPSSTLTQALSPPAWAPCQQACSWVSGVMQMEDHSVMASHPYKLFTDM